MYLVIPACGEGRGGGHLVRSLALVRSLRAYGAKAWLLDRWNVKADLPAGAARPAGAAFVNLGISADLLIEPDDASTRRWKLLVCDNYKSAKAEIREWRKWGPLLGIDEGAFRGDFDFLFDLLPAPHKHRPNLIDVTLNILPGGRREWETANSNAGQPGKPRVLVSFGAEDAAGLSVPAAKALLSWGAAPSVVRGPLFKDSGSPLFARIPVLESPQNVRELFASYDLLVTHFGLSAFEALYARVPVALVSPTACHKKLAKAAGFVFLTDLLKRPCSLEYSVNASIKAARRWGLDGEKGSLAAVLLHCRPRVFRRCPVCGKPDGGRAVARFPCRTYRRCSCGTIYLERLTPPALEYNNDYFFDSYKKQYGKTYLEDFITIKKNAAARLSRIQTLVLPAGKPRLLDIGCAYGPFLAAAFEAGFDPLGIDPAREAVDYVKNTLGLPALHGFFPLPADREQSFQNESFDVITMWFVIEHLTRPDQALREIHRLLKPGGVFAFSTPSADGVSARKNFNVFLEKSPSDHWTLWSRRFCGRILGRFGFTPVQTVSIGHHPERFPGGAAARFPRALLDRVSRVCGLGDSFEVYAVKKEGAWQNGF
ncbi:MAG: methyltransferase domain-containing protein [Treponema sp.]|jgi:SAM-dependent methyltransferase/spore coat polysaccharide biosynthesis predicted glycosyltransferase SpsG|nr:methyltransferase domain-containing protein [Treponema sp.]